MSNGLRELTLWAAQGPGGEIVRSSISTFRSDAIKWKIKKKNYEVIKLGSLTAHVVNSAQAGSVAPAEQKVAPVLTTEYPAEAVKEAAPVKRKPGRPLGSKNKRKRRVAA